MDGKFAVLFLALGAYDGISNKNQGYWPKKEAQQYIIPSAGKTFFQEEKNTNELGLDYLTSHQYGAIRPVFSSNITEKGALWFGYGGVYEKLINVRHGNIVLQSFLMPGLYHKGRDIELGSVLEFKSGFEFGFETPSKKRVSLHFSHRSNADTGFTNPGLENIHLRFSIPID